MRSIAAVDVSGLGKAGVVNGAAGGALVGGTIGYIAGYCLLAEFLTYNPSESFKKKTGVVAGSVGAAMGGTVAAMWLGVMSFAAEQGINALQNAATQVNNPSQGNGSSDVAKKLILAGAGTYLLFKAARAVRNTSSNEEAPRHR